MGELSFDVRRKPQTCINIFYQDERLTLHFTRRPELLIYLNLKITFPNIFADLLPIGFFVVFRLFRTYVFGLTTRLQNSNNFNEYLVHIFGSTFYSVVKYKNKIFWKSVIVSLALIFSPFFVNHVKL